MFMCDVKKRLLSRGIVFTVFCLGISNILRLDASGSNADAVLFNV